MSMTPLMEDFLALTETLKKRDFATSRETLEFLGIPNPGEVEHLLVATVLALLPVFTTEGFYRALLLMFIAGTRHAEAAKRRTT